MNAIELITTLQGLGVMLEARESRLRYCPRDAVSDDLLCEMRRHKAELLELLRNRTEVIPCPGDQCSERITLIGGVGWCPNHKMTIRLVDRLM